MAQGQRTKLEERRLLMCLRSLQSPLTLQTVTVTVTLSDWIYSLYRPNVILTLSRPYVCLFIHYIDNQVVNLCCAAYSIISLIVVWQFISTWNLGYRYFGILSVLLLNLLRLWILLDKHQFGIFFTARCTLVQSAVLRSHVVCLSVCL